MDNLPATIAARLEALRSTAFARYARGLVLRISLGGWFELYDLFMTAYISLGLVREGLFSITGAGIAAFASFVGAGFAGMFVGTLLFGWLSDRYGRRTTFTWSLAFYSIMTLLMALGPSALWIDIFRALAGIGIGVQIITIDAYVSEIAPAAQRGRLIAFSQFISYTSVPVVALLAALLVPREFDGFAGWRIVAMLGALGAIFVWPIRAGLPESPRWLAAHERGDEAERVVAQFERNAESRGEAAQSPAPVVLSVRHSWLDLSRPPYVRRTIMLVVFNFCQTIGFYGFASWVPLLLYKEGVAYVQDLQYVLIIALANPFGPILGMYGADRWQRKWQIVMLAGAIAVFGLLFAQARAPVAIVLLGVLITLANNWFSAAFHAYQAELFPTAIRAIGVGFVYGWSRFSAIFASYWIATVLARYGVPAVFALIACAFVIAAAAIASLGETTNRETLETLAP